MTTYRNRSVNTMGERGAALVTAILATAAVTILVFALTSLRVSEMNATAATVEVTQAQLAAEAGVDTVLGVITSTNALPPTSLSGDVDGYPFDVQTGTTADGLYLTVTSSGTVHDRTVTVEALLDVSERNLILEEYAILACHDLTLTGSADVVNGDVYSGGTLTVDKRYGLVNGDARAYGDVVINSESSVTGNAVSKTGVVRGDSPSTRGKTLVGGYAAFPEAFPYPEYTVTQNNVASGQIFHDPAYYSIPDYCEPPVYTEEVKIPDEVFEATRLQSVEDGTFLDGNQTTGTLPSPLEDGAIYYINGDLTLNGNFEASATFWVSGDLYINGGATVTSPDQSLAIVVYGDIVKGNGNASIDGVLYANGTMSMGNGTFDINGSLIMADQTGSSTLSGDLNVTYRRPGDDAELPNMVVVGADIQRWRLVSNP